MHTKGAGLPRRKSEWEGQPADAEASSGKSALCNGQVGAAGVGQGEVLHSGGAHQHIAEAHAGGRNGELRLQDRKSVGEGKSVDVGGGRVIDAAGHAAGGRWGELYAQGAGLPRGKREWKRRPADTEAGSGKSALRNCQAGAAGVGQGEVLHSVAAH